MQSRNTLRNMERLKNIALLLFLAVFVASLMLNVHHYTEGTAEPYRDTIKTTFVDTIPYYKPVPKDSTVIKYVTATLPKADDKEDNFPNKGDHFEEKDEMVTPNLPENSSNLPESDSVNVVIPITQKVYDEDTYTAFVSGYNPSLDSLIFKMPREVVTIKEYSKPKRWSVGVQVGYGVTLKGTPQFAPYVGIGVSYNLFSF